MVDRRIVEEWLYPVHWPTNYTKVEALKAKDAASRIGTAIKEALRK